MIKPGSLCYLNYLCGIPENIGTVVTAESLFGVENGINMWEITSQQPLLCYHSFLPFSMYRNRCTTSEDTLTPINGPEFEDHIEHEHETSLL
jgi:hypothetical protein